METIYLIAGTGKHSSEPAEAREFYQSEQFRAARALAEESGWNWFILSTEHGLLRPGAEVCSDSGSPDDMEGDQLKLWSFKVLESLLQHVRPGYRVIILGTDEHSKYLKPSLEALGVEVETPLETLDKSGEAKWISKERERASRIQTRRVSNWEDLSRAVNKYHSSGLGPDRRYAFRGQPERHPHLAPSLLRRFGDRELKGTESTIERRLQEDFSQHMRLHLSAAQQASIEPNSKFDLALLMQHYGAPTRLLDWTTSPFASVYFACAKAPQCDGEIWIVSTGAVNFEFEYPAPTFGKHKEVESLFVADSADGRLLFASPRSHDSRSAAQQSVFSVCNSPLKAHDDLILDAIQQRENKYPNPTPDSLLLAEKLVIPSEEKPGFMVHLRAMGISASSTYLGLVGLGQAHDELLESTAEDYAEHLEFIADQFKKNGSRE